MKKSRGLYMAALVIAVFAAALIWRMPVCAAEKEPQSSEEPVYPRPPEVGKPGDGGFIHFVAEPEFGIEDVTLQVNRITEGEEISRLTKNLDGAACIFEYKLLKDGQELHPDTRMEMGFELPDTQVGYYARVYRIEKDGKLTELLWSRACFYGYDTIGFGAWQWIGVTDYTIGRYLVVTPHVFGDVNGDGEIGAGDALEVLEMVVGLRDCSKDNLRLTADATGDGIIDTKDALEILRYVVKLESRISAWFVRIPV